MTQTDSVHLLSNEIRALNHRLDSIGYVVHDSQIGKDFFSTIVEEQTGIFSAIITLLAIISWAAIPAYFRRIMKKQANEFHSILEVQKNEYIATKEELKKLADLIERRSYLHKFDGLKSMYYISISSETYNNAIIYALRIAKLIMIKLQKLPDGKELNTSPIYEWLKMSKDDVELVDSFSKQDYHSINGILDELTRVEDNNIKEIILQIRQEIFKKYSENAES